MQESAFLDALRDAPADRLARLAYADWLEERDDPRAELIRVEEEMRLLPVFADRFWELKPRRNELRAASPSEWLAELGYGTVVAPVFRHGVPDGWRERWRLIREFVERWHRIPMPDVGGRQDEIRDAEARLGRTLPASVREWVAFAFDVRRNKNYHEVLRDSYQMESLDGFDAISLLLQGEGDYHWAVWHRNLGEDDPPVNGFHHDFDNDDEETFIPAGRNPIAPSVTSFVLGYAMDYTNGAGGFMTEVRNDPELLRNLMRTYPSQTTFERPPIFEGDTFQGTFEVTYIFEDDNIHIRLSPAFESSDKILTVQIFEPMPREAIPNFLWDLRRRGGWSQGMFTPAPETR